MSLPNSGQCSWTSSLRSIRVLVPLDGFLALKILRKDIFRYCQIAMKVSILSIVASKLSNISMSKIATYIHPADLSETLDL